MEAREVAQYVVDAYKKPYRSSKTLHPSGLGACDRKLILDALRDVVKEPDEALSWKLARYGTYEHLVLPGLKQFAADKVLAVVPQLELWYGWFHGFVDFALLGQSGNIYIEVKSSKPSAFGKGKFPYESHKAQAQAYYVMGKEKKPSKPTIAMLLYISRWKDDEVPDVEFYDVTPTEEEYDDVKSQLNVLNIMYDEGMVPPIPFKHSAEHPYLCTQVTNWKTRDREPTCPHFNECWKDELPL